MKYDIKAACRQRLDEQDHDESLIVHFILNTMGPLFHDKSPIPFKVEDGTLEIEVKLNGLEVDPTEFFKHLARECDRHADEAAKEKLKEPLGPLYEALENLRDEVEARVKDAIRQHLPKAREDRW